MNDLFANNIRRLYPTYYIKADNEVDVAYIDKGKFWPIEVKWTNQLRPQDLKQITKYHHGKVWAKIQQATEFQGTVIEPLPLALAKFMTR